MFCSHRVAAVDAACTARRVLAPSLLVVMHTSPTPSVMVNGCTLTSSLPASAGAHLFQHVLRELFLRLPENAFQNYRPRFGRCDEAGHDGVPKVPEHRVQLRHRRARLK